MITQFMKKEHCEATELDGEWIILNTENYTVTKINEVGGLCWSLLNEVQTVDSLTHHLMEKFSGQTSIETLKSDVEQFLSRLGECGLIQNVD